MSDVSANHLRGNEASNLVASCVMDRMAAADAFHYSSAIGDVHHPLLERLAPGMAENKARPVCGFFVMRHIRSRFAPRDFVSDCRRPGCGFGEGDGRELNQRISGQDELSQRKIAEITCFLWVNHFF
jgi:hypothetical protein